MDTNISGHTRLQRDVAGCDKRYIYTLDGEITCFDTDVQRNCFHLPEIQAILFPQKAWKEEALKIDQNLTS